MPLLAAPKGKPPVKLFGREATLWLTLVYAGINLLAGPVFHASDGQVAACTTIAGAVYTVLLAILVRPVDAAAIVGATTTMLNAAVAFGLDLSASTTGAVTAFVAAALGIILRMHVSPAPEAKARA